MGAPSLDELADSMYEMVKECHGKRNLKAMDLIKAMKEKYGEDASKPECKKAIRQLMDSQRCTYSYVGGSYVVLHPDNPDAK